MNPFIAKKNIFSEFIHDPGQVKAGQFDNRVLDLVTHITCYTASMKPGYHIPSLSLMYYIFYGTVHNTPRGTITKVQFTKPCYQY